MKPRGDRRVRCLAQRSCICAASLVVVCAVFAPAALAQHEPPNAQPGQVQFSLGVAGSDASGETLEAKYSVKAWHDARCAQIGGCSGNQYTPYAIGIYVDGPDGKPIGSAYGKVAGIPYCRDGAADPAISCDAPGRNVTNPADALPIGGAITFQLGAGAPSGSTAEIVIEGYGGLNSFATAPVKVPAVVLVTGLRDSTPGMQPGGDCSSIGSMTSLCAALQAAGFAVYVVPSSAGPGAVINNRAGIDANARALARYFANAVGQAFLVGHSMGGIISRVAISRYGAHALGLFTIGSPHDGSYGADLAEGARWFPCLTGVVCAAIHEAGSYAEQSFGAEAMRDLTATARRWDNLTLAPPGVRTWTFAGTACQGSPLLRALFSPYVFPNDGIVGLSSALGESANLGAPTRDSGLDYHEAGLQSLLGGAKPAPGCGSAPIELADARIQSEVIAAAKQVSSGGARDLIGHPARAGAQRQSPVIVELQTAAIRRVKPGSRVALDGMTALVSPDPFTVSCDGRPLAALPALGARAFGIPTNTLSCRRATLSGSHSLPIGIATDPDRVLATVTKIRGGVRIIVTASRTITGLALRRNNKPLRLRQRRFGTRAVQVSMTYTLANGVSLTAVVGGHTYSTTIYGLH